MDYEEGKIKLIKMFKKALKDADISRLNREPKVFTPKRLNENFKKRIISINKFLDIDGKIKCSFQKKSGYSINLSENDNDAIHISPVKTKFFLNWNSWKRTTGCWPFNAKKRKEEEMQNYMKNNNLFNATLTWEYGYDYKSRESVDVELETYAIFYGNYIRELTTQEYGVLTHEYLNKICGIDTSEIDRIIKI